MHQLDFDDIQMSLLVAFVQSDVESTTGKTLLLWFFSNTKPTEADILHYKLNREVTTPRGCVGREFFASAALENALDGPLCRKCKALLLQV